MNDNAPESERWVPVAADQLFAGSAKNSPALDRARREAEAVIAKAFERKETPNMMSKAPERPDLNRLLAEAIQRYEALSSEEREAHDKAQRESWVRGMMPTGDPRLD